MKFAKAVTKPGTLPVHAKTPIRMENLADFVGKYVPIRFNDGNRTKLHKLFVRT